MIPINKVRDLISKHTLLEKELSTGEINKKKFAEKSKEYSDLNDIIKQAKEYFSYEKEKNDLENIINDKSGDNEFKTMAINELNALKKRYEENENCSPSVLGDS